VDVTPLIDWALAQGKEVYLPIIRPDRHLDFARYRTGTRLEPNRVGILEPARANRELICPTRLDVVLTPLVGFDANANRLGMGGGFYDRTFAALNRFRHWSRPRLLGVAFECQRVSALTTQPWDVALWRVITETDRYPADRSHRCSTG
jgi:5-formyltetrahydrofolate cyclo-ligase